MIPRTRLVGTVVLPGFELLDLYGPPEICAMMPERVEIRLISATAISGGTSIEGADRPGGRPAGGRPPL